MSHMSLETLPLVGYTWYWLVVLFDFEIDILNTKKGDITMAEQFSKGFKLKETTEKDDRSSTGENRRRGSASKQGLQEIAMRQHYYEQQQQHDVNRSSSNKTD